MRRSSSGARVSEGGDAPSSSAAGHHGDGAGLPTFDPQSAAGRREAARTRALGRAVHCIPVLLVLCVLVLWFSSTSPVHLGRTCWLRADGKRLTCFCSRCWYGGSEVYFGEDRIAEECAARSLNQ